MFSIQFAHLGFESFGLKSFEAIPLTCKLLLQYYLQVIIQSDEKTLSEKEINNLSDKIIKTVEDKFNAKLR